MKNPEEEDVPGTQEGGENTGCPDVPSRSCVVVVPAASTLTFDLTVIS
jgi:hypothetical protein